MWINDLKARFQRSTERKVEELTPIEPEVQEPEEPEPVPEPLYDVSQVKIPLAWQGLGLDQAIYEALSHGDLALKAFEKEQVIESPIFTCVCGLTFAHRDIYEEHRRNAHPSASHEREIAAMSMRYTY